MTGAMPITDEQLVELLRETDPLADIGPSSTVERDRLLQRVLSSERASTRPGWQRARRRRLVLSAASGGGVAAAAVAAVLVFTAGNAPSVAFAGWSADPTAPANGQVQAAESECQRNSTLASLTPIFADTRGPYTLLAYAGNSGTLCVTGPSLQSPTGEPSIVPFGTFLSNSSAAERRAHPATPTPPNTSPIAPDAIERIVTGVTITKASAPSASFSLDVGRVGEKVTAVTFVLAGGSRVEATTANGWFAAWWPGGEPAQTAEITTTTGVTTQQLIPAGTPSAPASVQQGEPSSSVTTGVATTSKAAAATGKSR
jgi:hypothetical protein